MLRCKFLPKSSFPHGIGKEQRGSQAQRSARGLAFSIEDELNGGRLVIRA
jgi:hypothetical protein